MSHWCGSHPRYEAKREPGSLCGHCWRLWFLKNPELKSDTVRVYEEGKTLETDFARLDVSQDR